MRKKRLVKEKWILLPSYCCCVVICGLIWNNDGCLWFQEKPREEYNNNRGTQVKRPQQVGTRYLYLLFLIIILTNYWTIKIWCVLMRKRKRGKGKVKWWENRNGRLTLNYRLFWRKWTVTMNFGNDCFSNLISLSMIWEANNVSQAG